MEQSNGGESGIAPAETNRTYIQRMAVDAFKKVKNLEESSSENKDTKDKYASYATSLPVTIITNGLGQAAATLLAAAKADVKEANNVQKANMKLYKDLEHWLCRDDSMAPYYTPQDETPDLMRKIVESDRNTYMRAQAEALAWLQWLKKFATAYLKQRG
ncbi:type III-B CRISPR module-associated protein Cmr5 [Heliobacterium gestii]|uniref:CRISPR type III-B/RAMP module-associated protein Cmr5 n=2 Tax=Heliomicrobium gestii TaxID=2699 RepID=A0A845LGP9_HELGE|nr:type III-B CRISPR module-associated protein Cmr5 [Heliomicrobium gestii]